MSDATVAAVRWLRDETRKLEPAGAVHLVYHPLTYAWESHLAYLNRFGVGRKKALMVGMNPGPWGMGQIGIPFGDVGLVGEWMGLRGTPIGKPEVEHPKRPVQGWACTRREASGKRLWGLLQELYGTPERALEHLFIANHCPLLLFGATGTNITPDKLRKADREAVYAVCDEGVRRLMTELKPEVLIGVGGYAEARCIEIAESVDRDVRVLKILHPSPASPLANKDGGAFWRDNVRGVLQEAGLLESG